VTKQIELHSSARRSGQQRVPALTNPVAESVSISLPDISNKSISLNEMADRLARNPNSRPFHQMLALELRARAEPTRTDEVIAKAIQSYGNGDDVTLVALGSWLYSHGRFESMLGVLRWNGQCSDGSY